MVKKTLFITLGKFGKVSKKLGKEFAQNDIAYKSISWGEINNKGLLVYLINHQAWLYHDLKSFFVHQKY